MLCNSSAIGRTGKSVGGFLKDKYDWGLTDESKQQIIAQAESS